MKKLVWFTHGANNAWAFTERNTWWACAVTRYFDSPLWWVTTLHDLMPLRWRRRCNAKAYADAMALRAWAPRDPMVACGWRGVVWRYPNGQTERVKPGRQGYRHQRATIRRARHKSGSKAAREVATSLWMSPGIGLPLPRISVRNKQRCEFRVPY